MRFEVIAFLLVSIIRTEADDTVTPSEYDSNYGDEEGPDGPQGLVRFAFFRTRSTTTTRKPPPSFKPYAQMEYESNSIPEGSCGINVQMAANTRNYVNRVMNGVTASPNEFPWQVRVEVVPFSGDDAGSTFLCSGTIIAERWVLSAAHCFWEEGITKVYVGGDKTSKTVANQAYVMEVEEVFLHPRFNEDSLDFDIALIKLSEPLIYSDKIQPMCVPRRCTSDCEPGNSAVVSGWGTTSEEATKAQASLQKGNVTIVTNEVCQRGLNRNRIQRTITNRMICAGDPVTGTDTCKGDDGGPLACIRPGGGNYQLTGVKSVVDRCGKKGLYSVYIQPCRVIPWIDSVTGGILKPQTATKAPATRPGGNPATFAATPNRAPEPNPPTAAPAVKSTIAFMTTTTTKATTTTPKPTTTTTKPTTTTPKPTTTTTVADEPEPLPETLGWVNDPYCGRRNGNEMNALSYTKLLAQRKSNASVSRPAQGAQIRIVGGVDARTNEFPWQVRLMTAGSVCGGSLITEEWVITAAHCIVPEEVDGETTDIHLGSQYLWDEVPGEKYATAFERIQHPDYDGYTHYNDIALVLLEEPVEFSDTIHPICLLGSDCEGEALPDSQCTISGWGATKSGGFASETLQKATVNYVSKQECQRAYDKAGTGDIIFDGQSCAGYIQGGIDTCQGDSGGPLVCKHKDYPGNAYFLHGATSYGYGCAQAGYYGVYAKPCHYMDWITCVVQGGNPDDCNEQESIRKGRAKPQQANRNSTTTVQPNSRAGRVGTRSRNFIGGTNPTRNARRTPTTKATRATQTRRRTTTTRRQTNSRG